ncbi:hypothetical protein ACP4OV_019354 [Aristida adscensionis]
MDADRSPFPWAGSSKLKDSKIKARDFYGDELNLFLGTYSMDSLCDIDVMIKMKIGLNQDTYDHLRNFRHHAAVPLLDMFIKKGNPGRLVIPPLTGCTSFTSWFDHDGKDQLFNGGHMTQLLRNMIIDLCSLTENLLEYNLIITELSEDNNVYVSLQGGSPRVLVLLEEVEKLKTVGPLDARRSWDKVRDFISLCEHGCGEVRDELTACFCNFIGSKTFKTNMLNLYPDNWSYETKGKYLMSLISADNGKMRDSLNGRIPELDWPYERDPHIFQNLPRLLCLILDWEEYENGRKFSTKEFFDYLILMRNCFKHQKKLPRQIKDILSSREAIVKTIEEWSPNIWIKIYERIDGLKSALLCYVPLTSSLF